MTGFTGSAGFAIVLKQRAALFVDGRYTLQAGKQADTSLFDIVHLIEEPPSKWLAGKLAAGDRIGYDPWLLTVREVRRLREVCEAAGAALVPLAANPVDAIWDDRPAPPLLLLTGAADNVLPPVLAGRVADAYGLAPTGPGRRERGTMLMVEAPGLGHELSAVDSVREHAYTFLGSRGAPAAAP